MMGGVVWSVLLATVYTRTLLPQGEFLETFVFPVEAESVTTLSWTVLDSVLDTPPDSVFVSTQDTVVWTPSSVLEWTQVEDSLVITVHPWSGSYRYTTIEVTYTTVPASGSQNKVPLETFLQISRPFVNLPPANLQGPPDLVVITTPALLGAAEEYFETHLFLGHHTVIYTTDWVDGRTGATRQERIRNLLREIWEQWGTFSVLLVGPVSELPGFPTRVPQHQNPQYDDFPTDYFYGALMSGTLDLDGDGLLGEFEDSVDLTVQLPVARLVVGDSATLARYREKMWDWWTNPPASNTLIKMVAEFPDGSLQGRSYVDYAVQDLAALMDTTSLYENLGNTVDITVERYRDSLNAPHRVVVALHHSFFNKFWVNSTPVVEFWRADGDFLDTTAARFLWFPFVCDAGAYDLQGLIPDYVLRRGGPVGAWATVRLNYPSLTQWYYYRTFQQLAQNVPLGEAVRWSLNVLAPYASGGPLVRYHHYGFSLQGDPLLPLWIGVVSPAKVEGAYVVNGSQVDVEVRYSLADSGRVVVWRPATGEYYRAFVTGRGTLTYTFERIGAPDTLWITASGKKNTLEVNTLVLPQDNQPYLADHWVEFTSSGGVYVHTRVVDPDGSGTFTVYPAEGTWNPSSVSLTNLATDTVLTWQHVDGPLPAFYTFVVDQKSWKIWVGSPEESPDPRLWTALSSSKDSVIWVYDMGSQGTYRLQMTGANGTVTRTGTLLEDNVYRFAIPYAPHNGETLQVRVDRYISALRVWTAVLRDTLVWHAPPAAPDPGGFLAVPGGVKVLGSLPEGSRGGRILPASGGVGFLFEGTLPVQVGLGQAESLWLYALDSSRILSAPVFAGVGVPGPVKLWEVSLGNVQPLWAPVIFEDTTVLVWDDGGWLHAVTPEGKEQNGFPIPVQGVPVSDPVAWQQGDTLLVAWPLNTDVFLLKVWPGGLNYSLQGLGGYARVVGVLSDNGVAVYAFIPDRRVFRYESGAWVVKDTLPGDLIAPPAVWNDGGKPVLVLSISGQGLVAWRESGQEVLTSYVADFLAVGDVDSLQAGEEIVWRVGDSQQDTLFVGGRSTGGTFVIHRTLVGAGLPDPVTGVLGQGVLWLWNTSQVVAVNLLTGGRQAWDVSQTATLVRREGVLAGDGAVLPTWGSVIVGEQVDGFPLELGQMQRTPSVLGSNLLAVALDDGRVVGLKLPATDTSSAWPAGGHDLLRTRNLTTVYGLAWPQTASGVASAGLRVLPLLKVPRLMRAGQVVLVNPVARPLTLDFFNALGRRVRRVELRPLGTSSLRLEMPGVYFLRVRPEDVVRAPRKVLVIR